MAYHLSKRRNNVLTLAATRSVGFSLIIAEQKGFFHEHNISIKDLDFPFARKGMEAMLEGRVDLAHMVETNVAYLGYIAPPIPYKCFVSIEKRTGDTILMHGEACTPKDIIGKKVGFMPRTTSHTFIARFMEHHNLPFKSIKLKTITPQAMPDAFLRKEVDAISVWRPYSDYATQGASELGIPFTLFKNDGFHKSETLIGAPKSLLVKQRKNIERFLKALIDANTYINANTDTFINIVSEKTKIPPEHVKSIIKGTSYNIAPVSPSYLENIKTIAEWIRTNDTQYMGQGLPDYEDFVDNSILIDILEKMH